VPPETRKNIVKKDRIGRVVVYMCCLAGAAPNC